MVTKCIRYLMSKILEHNLRGNLFLLKCAVTKMLGVRAKYWREYERSYAFAKVIFDNDVQSQCKCTYKFGLRCRFMLLNINAPGYRNIKKPRARHGTVYVPHLTGYWSIKSSVYHLMPIKTTVTLYIILHLSYFTEFSRWHVIPLFVK